jgi:hypothetical protein
MQIAYCSGDLPEIERSQILFTIVSVPNFFEETSMGSQLKQKVDFAVI